jgi:FAD/FMN-containing dehydrogenase
MNEGLLAELEHIVGPGHVLTEEADVAPYVVDWRGAYRGRALAVVRPDSTEAVAHVVRACSRAGAPMVPQGGNTGMCGGAMPGPRGDAVVVALGRMNRILSVDPLNDTLSVQAGCILRTVQEAARGVDRLFPLSLGAEGSCQIGGNIATNAGGINVLRYGNTRDLVLGLEAVLPDGTVWDGMRALRKDNRGYDLKQLFIGAEGTLGIITGAVLKLFPRPRAELSAMLAVAGPEAAVELLAALRERCGDALQAYELIGRLALDLVFAHVPAARDPFARPHAWYVLLELGTVDAGLQAREQVEAVLASALETGLAEDAVIAESLDQAAALWRLREGIPESTRLAGPAFRSDIAVAVNRLPAFIDAAESALRERHGAARIVCFGHVGDGNLHFNALVPEGENSAAWSEAFGATLYDVVQGFDGSFSAEHGIGQAKRTELLRYKSPIELGLMRTLKQALDPHGLMNPGKVLMPDENAEKDRPPRPGEFHADE